jgi:hypothetical protein
MTAIEVSVRSTQARLPRSTGTRAALVAGVVAAGATAALSVAHINQPDYSGDRADGHAFANTHGIAPLAVGQRAAQCMNATRAIYDDDMFMTPHYKAPGAEMAFWQGCSGAIDD